MTNKKLYLIGDPVDHSLSPLLHGAMIAQTGVHYTYEVRRVQPRDLADFVAEAKAGGCAGFNVTMPHKEAILPLLDELSPAAAACGAAAAKGLCPIPRRTTCVMVPSGADPRRCTIPPPSGRLSSASSFRATPAGWTASAVCWPTVPPGGIPASLTP